MISVMMEVTGMWWITRAREWLFAELGRLRITATRENSMTEMRYWFLQIAFVLLGSPAALGLLSSSAEASPCLSSASAVRQEHPGSWPTWTLRAQGHEGVKCWFPTTGAPGRDQTTRQISPAETATAVRASTPNTRDPDNSGAPEATNGVGRSRETLRVE
jgi:hypothetical protein